MIRHFLMKLLRSAAQRRLVEAVDPSARLAAANADYRDVSLAVVATRRDAVEPLCERLEGAVATAGAGFELRLGKLIGQRTVVAVDDRECVADATSSVILAHQPALVVAVGLATALVKQLSRGDLVLAESFVAQGEEVVRIDLRPNTQNSVHVGRLLSITALPKAAKSRLEMADEFGVLAADSSAYGVARACRELQCPMMAAHVVTMEVDDQRPADVEHMLEQRSWAGRAGALLGGVTRRPGAATDLWNRQQQLWQAGERLAEVVVQLLPASPSSKSSA